MDRLTALGTGNAAVTRCYNTCFLLELPHFFSWCLLQFYLIHM